MEGVEMFSKTSFSFHSCESASVPSGGCIWLLCENILLCQALLFKWEEAYYIQPIPHFLLFSLKKKKELAFNRRLADFSQPFSSYSTWDYYLIYKSLFLYFVIYGDINDDIFVMCLLELFVS